jgi:hypothetical protein
MTTRVRPALQAQVLDVRTGGLGNPRAVEGQQRLVVDPRTPDVRRGRVVWGFLLDGVPVEPGDSGQPPGDGGPARPRESSSRGGRLDVGAAHGEQRRGPRLAPAGELTQVKGVGLSGQAAVSGQVTGEREPLGIGERRLDRHERS